MSSSSSASSPSLALGPPRSSGTTHMTHRSSDASVAAAARSSSAPRGVLRAGTAVPPSLAKSGLGDQTRGDAPSFSASSSSPPSSSSSSFDGSMRSPFFAVVPSKLRSRTSSQLAGEWKVAARACVPRAAGAAGRRRGGDAGRDRDPPPPPPPPAGSTRSMARSPEDGEGGAVGSRGGLRRAGREGRPRERAPRSARRSSDAETRRVTATVLRRGIRARGGGASRSVISALAASTPAEPTARAVEANNDRVEEKFTTSRASFF